MISDTQNSNNLAKEVEKKKKQMQLQQNSEKKRMIIAYSVVGAITLILIVFAVIQYGSSDEVVNQDFETPIGDTDKYNSKIEALEVKNKQISNDNLLDIFTPEEDKISAEDNTDVEDNLRKSIEALEPSTPSKVKTNSTEEVYGDYSMWEKENKNRSDSKNSTTSDSNYNNTSKELSYEERLEKARNTKKNTSVKKVENNVIETRAAIFRDQFKLPGELVELVLTKDFNYNGNLFKKGTLLYADMNINQTRVLFDISNIAHQPIKLEVRDIRDGRIGMYSTRAGELWDDYQRDAMNEATNEASNEVTGNATTRILNGSINALSNFFQRKRLRQSEKILLLNDQELIIHILEND